MVALMLGLVGGIIGIVEMVLTMAYGGGTHPGVNSHTTFAAVISLLGAIMALPVMRFSKVASIGMLIAGLAGFAAMGLSYIPPGVLLILGGIIGWFSNSKSANNL